MRTVTFMYQRWTLVRALPIVDNDLCNCKGKVIFIPKTDGFTWIDESALVEVDKCWGEQA